ncbi:MAG TPA: hypothetical protein VN285_02080 [Candidatus Deferrimicrobium sp.]|nr:hypothetical protein [Candidatus Deferrimicrobium sp.]
MYLTPQYDFRDVLLAPAKALSAKKIFLMTLALCVALVVYDAFTYLAVAISGESAGSFFAVYGLLPITWLSFSSVVARFVYILGVAGAVLAFMLGCFGVSALNVEEMRGNRFFATGGVMRFSLRRFTQLFLAELAIVLFVAFIVLLAFVLGLVARIPFLGEWLYALFFVVPNFIVALFCVFIIFVTIASVILLPAVAAAERHGEVFAVLLETFSTIIRQPVRWLLYTGYSLAAAKVCGFVFAYFAYRAVQFLSYSASLGAGNKVWRLLKSGMSHLPTDSRLVEQTCNIFPGIKWSFSISRWTYGGGDQAAGYLMAVMLFLVFAIVIGYMLAIVATAQARAFAVIRCVKDGYKISDEAPLFFQEEHVNPPVEETGESQSGEDRVK